MAVSGHFLGGFFDLCKGIVVLDEMKFFARLNNPVACKACELRGLKVAVADWRGKDVFFNFRLLIVRILLK